MTAVNFADRIALGSGQASAVYAGSTLVWPQFKPNNLAGCMVWLDASRLHLVNGALVSAWPNLGSGSQPTKVGYPFFRAASRNGLPIVQLSENDRFRFYSGTGVDKDWTLVYYARKWSLLLPGRLATAFSTTSNLLVGYHGNEFDQCYVEGWLTSGSAPAHTTQWRLYSADSTSSAPARFFVNGALNASGTVTPAKGWGGTLCINGYTDDGTALASQSGNFEVAELVMYNRKLSDVERQQVENYLRVKWGAPQPFTPADLGSNLLGWFDPGSVTLVGNKVSSWYNKSGGAFTLTQSDDAARPTYANSTVTFVSPQRLMATNSPATYDFIVVGKPYPPSAPEHRTLLRGIATGPTHQLLLEPGNARLAVWNSGFFPAGNIFPPLMTSNTTPAPFAASAVSSYPGGYWPYEAFDRNRDTFWHSADAVPGHIRIDLDVPRTIASYIYQPPPSAGQAWKSWILYAINDGDPQWTAVDTVNNEPAFVAGPGERRTYLIDAPGTFRIWQWNISASQHTHAAAGTLELLEPLVWNNVWGIGYGRMSSAAPAALSRDGSPLASTGTTIAAADVPVAAVGGLPGGGQPWGDVKEIIFVAYNSEGHRPMLEGYLAHKHGLTGLLPANHPYKTTPP